MILNSFDVNAHALVDKTTKNNFKRPLDIKTAMKELVDTIIRNADALTMDEEARVLRHIDIAIDKGYIKNIGNLRDYEGTEELDATGKVAMPGFVDAHTHPFQILLRGSLSLKDLNVHPIWLKVLIPFEAGMSEEEGTLSAQLACLNMIRKGITAYADSGGPYPDVLGHITDLAGIRGRITYSTMDKSSFESYYHRAEENRALVRKWGTSGRVQGYYSIREIMTSSDELIEKTFRYAEEDGARIHLHLAEEFSEVEHALNRWGERPVEHLYRKGFLSSRLIAAHSAFLSDYEIQMYAETGVNPVHCPTINMTYMTFPKVPQMLNMGINVAIGSDGGSYRGLDMFTEINVAMASLIGNYGTPYYDFGSLQLGSFLRMATRNGYLAIGENMAGEIRPGYKGDIILVDTRKAHLVPLYDPASLPLFATGNDISDVIVDGRVLMKGGQVLSMDEEAIVKKAREIGPQVMERFGWHIN